MFDKIVLWALKLLYVGVFVFFNSKVKSAKKMDPTLTLKLNLRSKVELYGIILLSVAFIVYPGKSGQEGFTSLIGSVIFVFMFFTLERLVAAGRKIIFARFFAFDVKQIHQKTYQKGIFEFKIKDASVKVRFPVADMAFVMQMLSGTYRKRKSQK